MKIYLKICSTSGVSSVRQHARNTNFHLRIKKLFSPLDKKRYHHSYTDSRILSNQLETGMAQVHSFRCKRCTGYTLLLLPRWSLVLGRYSWFHQLDSSKNRQSSSYNCIPCTNVQCKTVLAWIFYQPPCSPEAGVLVSLLLLLFGIQL